MEALYIIVGIAVGYSIVFCIQEWQYKKRVEKKRQKRIKYADDKFVESMNGLNELLGKPKQTRDELLAWKYGNGKAGSNS
jgi:hypothetical protein